MTAIAALAMSSRSAVVAINALMLKRTKLAGIHPPGKSETPVGAGMRRSDNMLAM